MTLKTLIENNGLTMGKAASLLKVDKSQIVKICSHNYPSWEQKESEFIATLKQLGYTDSIAQTFAIDTNILVATKSVSNFTALADDLSDPDGTLSSSIGMAIGTAER